MQFNSEAAMQKFYEQQEHRRHTVEVLDGIDPNVLQEYRETLIRLGYDEKTIDLCITDKIDADFIFS
ncbi:hypothetical protein FACS1894214_2700 [Planctomycetales bacterium]|nr:hypothetical protein FACS1894214_2700 [Planctomycetales bacterium]